VLNYLRHIENSKGVFRQIENGSIWFLTIDAKVRSLIEIDDVVSFPFEPYLIETYKNLIVAICEQESCFYDPNSRAKRFEQFSFAKNDGSLLFGLDYSGEEREGVFGILESHRRFVLPPGLTYYVSTNLLLMNDYVSQSFVMYDLSLLSELKEKWRLSYLGWPNYLDRYELTKDHLTYMGSIDNLLLFRLASGQLLAINAETGSQEFLVSRTGEDYDPTTEYDYSKRFSGLSFFPEQGLIIDGVRWIDGKAEMMEFELSTLKQTRITLDLSQDLFGNLSRCAIRGDYIFFLDHLQSGDVVVYDRRCQSIVFVMDFQEVTAQDVVCSSIVIVGDKLILHKQGKGSYLFDFIDSGLS